MRSSSSARSRQTGIGPGQQIREGKYARVERERRFLLTMPPPASVVTASRRITDRYLPGTRLRLRRVDWLDSEAREFKFTQKLPAGRPGPVRGLITSTYLSGAEYDLLASLPADVITKTRVSSPPLSVDIFDPPLHGLVLAEAEFTSDEAALAFPLPAAAVAEVTDDTRFAGDSLARVGRAEVTGWLAEYGIALEEESTTRGLRS